MSTSQLLFTSFFAIGLVFFFAGCFIASRPASGTTEWIKYICGRKFTFCPAPQPLTKFDIIPMTALTLAACGVMFVNALFLDHISADAPLFVIGTGVIYLSHLLFVAAVPLLYLFLKNLTGGYITPVCGTALMLLDGMSFTMAQNTGTAGASLLMLTAIYIAYRYTVSAQILYLPFVGIALGLGMVFNSSSVIAVVGIIAVFIIREAAFYRENENKRQTAVRSIIFALSCIILPVGIYVLFIGFTNSFASIFTAFASDFRLITGNDILSMKVFSLMVFVGGICAVPVCIYRALKAKEGTSLFTVIIFGVYILNLFVSDLRGLFPIFTIPAIACAFSALHTRKLYTWLIAYPVTAALYLGAVFAFTVM
ncbi:MAG: hypothetical protein E7456_05200 [Ruminococcaceae bacterium]|nr:hypothetical protein [Oscillospiraceae bacterium]